MARPLKPCSCRSLLSPLGKLASHEMSASPLVPAELASKEGGLPSCTRPVKWLQVILPSSQRPWPPHCIIGRNKSDFLAVYFAPCAWPGGSARISSAPHVVRPPLLRSAFALVSLLILEPSDYHPPFFHRHEYVPLYGDRGCMFLFKIHYLHYFIVWIVFLTIPPPQPYKCICTFLFSCAYPYP